MTTINMKTTNAVRNHIDCRVIKSPAFRHIIMCNNIKIVAYDSLSSANKGNPFISKSSAMTAINEARLGKSCPNAIVLNR